MTKSKMSVLVYSPIFGALFAVLVAAGFSGCSAVNKQIVDALVKKALAECIAENAHLGEVELQHACAFADDLWPVVRDLVMAQKKGLAKAAAAKAAGPQDAGTVQDAASRDATKE